MRWILFFLFLPVFGLFGQQIHEPSTLVEGCSPALEINLQFESLEENDFPLHWEIKGNALPNIDFVADAYSGELLSPMDELRLTLAVIDDQEQEAIEEIILSLSTASAELFDYVWFITDPLEELSFNQDVICASRYKRYYIEGQQPAPNSYPFSISEPIAITDIEDEAILNVSEVPFEYLASPHQIASICIEIKSAEEFRANLVSPDGTKILLTLNGKGNYFNACFSSDALHSVQFDYDDLIEGSYYPIEGIDGLFGSTINGDWQLEVVPLGGTNYDIEILAFALTFRETGTPFFTYNWEYYTDAYDVFIHPSTLVNFGTNFNASLQVGDCFWQGSMVVNTTSVTNYAYQDTICREDTVWIDGKSFYRGNLERLLVYPNAIDCCCDSIVFVQLSEHPTAFQFDNYFVNSGNSFEVENESYAQGAYDLISNTLSSEGCDSLIFFNVIEAREEIYWESGATIFSKTETSCNVVDRFIEIDSMQAAIFHDYNIYVKDTLLGTAMNFGSNFDLYDSRCLSLSSIDEVSLYKIENQSIESYQIDRYYFRTKAELIEILNDITYPDYIWSFNAERNRVCPNDFFLNVPTLQIVRFNTNTQKFGAIDYLQSLWTLVKTKLILPAVAGENEYIFQSKTGKTIDTLHYSLQINLPIGITDSLVIQTQPGEQSLWPLWPTTLCGPIESVTQVCEDTSSTAISFSLVGADTLQFNTFTFGTRSICYELCDSFNVCDTLVITIEVPEPSGIANNQLDDGVKVFPNPADDRISIIASDQQLESYQIFDLQGKLVLTGKFFASLKEISVNDLSAGIYFLKVKGGEKVFVQRLLIH